MNTSPHKMNRWQISTWKIICIISHESNAILVRDTITNITTELHTVLWQGYGGTRTLIHGWEKSKMIQSFWKSVWSVLKFKHVFTIWPIHFTPKYLPRRNESICSFKDLHVNVHISFICNSHKLKLTQIFIRRWMDRQTVAYKYNGILFINALLTDAAIWMNQIIMLKDGS